MNRKTSNQSRNHYYSIIIPNHVMNAHTPYPSIIIKYITRENMAFPRSSLPHPCRYSWLKLHQRNPAIINQANRPPDHKTYINTAQHRRSLICVSQEPVGRRNYINTTLVWVMNREDPYLSVAWTTQPPDHKNYSNTTLLSWTGK